MPPASPPPPSGTTHQPRVRRLARDLEPHRAPGRPPHRAGRTRGPRACRARARAARPRPAPRRSRRPRRSPRRRTGAPRPPWRATPARASRAARGVPAARAAKATAWAWLPALAATTPAASSASDSRLIAFVAPRALNEPVTWRFSALSAHAGARAGARARPRAARASPSPFRRWSRRGLVNLPLADLLGRYRHDVRAHHLEIMRLWPRRRRRPGCSRTPRSSPAWSSASSRRSRRWPCRAAGSAARSCSARGTPATPATSFARGAVLLTREHQDGRLVALAEFRAGGLFGELAMFRGETRSATAEAIEDTAAVALLAGDVQRPGAPQPRPRAEAAGRARRAREHHHRAAPAASPSRRWPAAWPAPCSPSAWHARPRAHPTATC